jgi:hypothetical protein
MESLLRIAYRLRHITHDASRSAPCSLSDMIRADTFRGFVSSGNHSLYIISARTGLLADVFFTLLLSPHRNIRLGPVLQK